MVLQHKQAVSSQNANAKNLRNVHRLLSKCFNLEDRRTQRMYGPIKDTIAQYY